MKHIKLYTRDPGNVMFWPLRPGDVVLHAAKAWVDRTVRLEVVFAVGEPFTRNSKYGIQSFVEQRVHFVSNLRGVFLTVLSQCEEGEYWWVIQRDGTT